jgi:hypothetical protein
VRRWESLGVYKVLQVSGWQLRDFRDLCKRYVEARERFYWIFSLCWAGAVCLLIASDPQQLPRGMAVLFLALAAWFVAFIGVTPAGEQLPDRKLPFEGEADFHHGIVWLPSTLTNRHFHIFTRTMVDSGDDSGEPSSRWSYGYRCEHCGELLDYVWPCPSD